MSHFTSSLASAKIIKGFLVNLTGGLTLKDYVTSYKSFYAAPVKALDGDVSYTENGIVLQNVADATRVIVVVQHASEETLPGSFEAYRRGKKLYTVELDRGASCFFPHPLYETLISISREQDMHGTTRKNISPKGLLAKQVEGTSIVLGRGDTPGDVNVKILSAGSDGYANVINNTPYAHVVTGEQPSQSFPERAHDQFHNLDGNCRPDKGPNRVFGIRVAAQSAGTIKVPPEMFGIYALETVQQMDQGDPIDNFGGEFYGNIRGELPTSSQICVVAYATARRGQVVTLCNASPATGNENFCVKDACNSSAVDYSMIFNEA